MLIAPDTKLKVLIFAVSNKGLLAFSEPDFPHIPLQVPGGSVEPGEDLAFAARREFLEETGLEPAADFEKFFVFTYEWPHSTASQTRFHQRHCFTLQLPDDLPETWDHFERHASSGAAPIRFRFQWLPRHRAQQSLGWGMSPAVKHLFS